MTVAAMVMQTLPLVPDDRVVEQVEVSADELADQLNSVSLVLLQLSRVRRYLHH